jgi:LuxR family maltose regulon positive regulatory protein
MELLEQESAHKHSAAAVELARGETDDRATQLAALVYNSVHFDQLPEKRRAAQEFTTSWPTGITPTSSTSSVVVSLHVGLRMASHLREWRWSERLLDRARQLLGESFDWQIAYALYLLDSSRAELASSVVEPLLRNDRLERLPLSDIVGWSLQAVLELGVRNPFRAHTAIYRSLERADETGAYFEVSRAGSKSVAELLSSGSGRFGPHEHVARALLTEQIGESILACGPLTDRERQILLELTTLRTVQEIARDLLLSVNTVKTHMRGVYRKLDVTSRRQAVAKAERIGLL